MSNPYSVLGVSQSATDEQVKIAYLDLVEKYSPVNYTQNPLSDLAEDKLKQVNDAYDEIMAQRRVSSKNTSGDGYVPYNSAQSTGSYSSQSSGSYSSPNTNSYQYSDYASGGNFSAVRAMLNRNDLAGAENALLSMSQAQRGAEWNYLMGRVAQGKGWLDQAATYYQNAASIEPNNPDYQSAVNNLNSRRTSGYRSAGSPYNTYNGTNTGCGSCGSGCNLCSSLICADCCCEMMGGDFIRCI